MRIALVLFLIGFGAQANAEPLAIPEERVQQLLPALEALDFDAPPQARQELLQRLERAPLKVAEQLAAHYGRDYSVHYIPAVAMIGRYELAQLQKEPETLAAIHQQLLPCVSGVKPTLKRVSGPALAGHLIFARIAPLSVDPKPYTQLVIQAANVAFDEAGRPRPAMPSHNQMSDAVFMGGPILTAAGKLTGEARYFEMAARHLRHMQKLCLREDSLFRHHPGVEAAWGRGNGFPALGLALMLEDLPAEAAEREFFLNSFKAHMQALKPHQDQAGMWHQVIDQPESYPELTATCMIGYAAHAGVRQGWLNRAEWQPAIEKAWEAASTRIGPEGELISVCPGTGKLPDLQSYLDRPAIVGKDDRGGAMALLFATELAKEE